ncbi:MAG: NUDIX domain-containing protein [Beijerinckiaceae bacterium]|nr:NUDIX domain-containing protein [Beijerinckiaceae bacterium]
MSTTTARRRDRKPLLAFFARGAFKIHRLLWWTRALTIGVRAVVFDDAGRVLLVRHTYIAGWHFPGGGIGRRETTEDAVIRELREEAGLQCAERPVLHGLFRHAALKHDHVACYVIREFTAIPGATPDWEIAETGFFPLENLPDGVTSGTKARLAEILGGQPVAREW